MKKRDIAKAAAEVASLGIAICSGFVANRMINAHIPASNNKAINVITKIGVTGIISMVETKVMVDQKESFDDLIDNIAAIYDEYKFKKMNKKIDNHMAETKKFDSMQDVDEYIRKAYSSHSGDAEATVIPFKQPEKSLQAISFADEDTARYAEQQLKIQYDEAGKVSLWYLFNCLDEDKVQTTMSEDDMRCHGWDNLDDMTVLYKEEDGQWLLVLPECVTLTGLDESVLKHKDGTTEIVTNTVKE